MHMLFHHITSLYWWASLPVRAEIKSRDHCRTGRDHCPSSPKQAEITQAEIAKGRDHHRRLDGTGEYQTFAQDKVNLDRPALPSFTITQSLLKVPLRLFSHLLTHFWQEIASFSLFPFHNPLTARLSDYIQARHINIELHINGWRHVLEHSGF